VARRASCALVRYYVARHTAATAGAWARAMLARTQVAGPASTHTPQRGLLNVARIKPAPSAGGAIEQIPKVAGNRLHAGPYNRPAVPGRLPKVARPLGSPIRRADTCIPSRASADGAASLAHRSPRDAYSIDSGPAQATSDSYLCDHAVRRSKRRRRHALCRGCDC
jgi:hypothetical protein